jgi:hypothetical protein
MSTRFASFGPKLNELIVQTHCPSITLVFLLDVSEYNYFILLGVSFCLHRIHPLERQLELVSNQGGAAD